MDWERYWSTEGNLVRFVTESNGIEGICREPTEAEIVATSEFLALPALSIDDVCRLQAVVAPGKPLRLKPDMNVRVGNHVAPQGGPEIAAALDAICSDANDANDRDAPRRIHVKYEKLHPFLDGNGRTGRAIWAWSMRKTGQNPFSLSFLHRFYYQTLAASQ